MAAGSVIPFNIIRYQTLKAQIDFDSGGATFKVALLEDTYTPDVDADEFWDDVSAHEASGTGYTADGETLANQVVTRDDPNNRSYLDGDNISWPASSITARYAVIYKDTGTPATSTLVGYIDFGGNEVSVVTEFLIQWNSSGILEI